MACPNCGVPTPDLTSNRMEGNTPVQSTGPSWCKGCIQDKIVAARGGVTGPVPEPQPKHKLPPVHMVKEMKRDDKNLATAHTLCGAVGRPRGMYGNMKDEVSITGWPSNVTCPMCKRMPSVKMWYDQQSAAEEEMA